MKKLQIVCYVVVLHGGAYAMNAIKDMSEKNKIATREMNKHQIARATAIGVDLRPKKQAQEEIMLKEICNKKYDPFFISLMVQAIKREEEEQDAILHFKEKK